MLLSAYLTLLERKSDRVHAKPHRAQSWPLGLAQPIADVIKLIAKEIIIPTASNRFICDCTVISIGTAFAGWAIIPFDKTAVLANINAGVLYSLAISSLGVYGILIAGWASN